VFSRTKHGANKLAKCLEKDGLSAAAIHGNKSQTARTKALADFKANRIQVLVATDIAARGIDIDDLPRVINFDLPNVSEDYVHRIGRTGRAGATGLAMSLVSPEETVLLRDIERLIKRKIDRADLPQFLPRAARSNASNDEPVEAREERPARNGNGNNRRRRSGSKPNTKREDTGSRSTGQRAKHRPAANEEQQDGKPKRRRRSRSRNRNAQGGNTSQENGNRNRNSQGGQQEHSLGARIKRLFGGSKVA